MNEASTLYEKLVFLAEDFVKRRSTSQRKLWSPPLIATASLDERFDILGRITSPEHLSPKELLPGAKTVIVFFVPFSSELVRENKEGERPSRSWGVAYVKTNQLIGDLAEELKGLLHTHGGHASALTPPTHNFDRASLMSRWSHKHLGYLVGLGRFGLHRMLITPSGCAGRLGSLVTEAELGDHPLTVYEEACLFKAGYDCGRCMEACPVGAIGEDHFDRKRCWDRLVDNRLRLEYFFDLPQTTHVCGKCASVMPCSFKAPVRDMPS